VIDPLGGINTLWPLFGIANQMFAGIALVLCTCVLFKMKARPFCLRHHCSRWMGSRVHACRRLAEDFRP
jgi:carbon starvation protein CstA